MQTTTNLIPVAHFLTFESLYGIEADALHGLLNSGIADFVQTGESTVELQLSGHTVATITEDDTDLDIKFSADFAERVFAAYNF